MSNESSLFSWAEAPVKTQWGDGMMVTDIAVSADETVSIYAHKEATALFERLWNTRHTPDVQAAIDAALESVIERMDAIDWATPEWGDTWEKTRACIVDMKGANPLAERAARIAELEHEKSQCAEALQAVAAGVPLGPVVGMQTIINQQRTITDLTAQLEAARKDADSFRDKYNSVKAEWLAMKEQDNG